MTDKLARISQEKIDLTTRLSRLDKTAQEYGEENITLSQKLATTEMELEMTKANSQRENEEVSIMQKNQEKEKEELKAKLDDLKGEKDQLTSRIEDA